MSERHNPFADPTYVQGRIYYIEAEAAAEESYQRGRARQADINFEENIHPRAREATQTIELRTREAKERQQALIDESNRLEFMESDQLGFLHLTMRTRYKSRAMNKMLNQIDNHGRQYRPGWGPGGMLTRTQYQSYLERFHDRRRNEQLNLDEQADRITYPELYE